MAYSVKYLFKFESSNGTTREIRVLQDGYSGEVIQRPLGRAPVLKKQQNGPVHGTSLEFYAECHVDREFIEFYTSDPKAYRVDLYAGATLLWQGYITPELYSEPDIAPPYDVQVVATDGVGELKLYDYAAQGTVTLRALLSGLLSRTGLGTDIYLISSLKAGSRGAGALLDMTINLDYMEGESCYDVLTYLLDTLHATITWWKGAWILTRETNVTFTSGKVRYFNTAGNSALLADSVQTLGSLRSNPAWPVGQLSTVLDPAKNRVTVQAPWHVVTGLQNSDMTSDASWAKSNDASYGPDGYLFPNNDEGTSTYATAYISQALAMEGLRVPMSFELRATGVSAQVGVRVGAVIGVLLTYTVGNVVYHLRKGSEGTPEWTPGPAIGATIDGSLVDYQRPLASFDMDRIQAETLQITEIPAFVQGTSYPSGTLTVYILGTCARVYAATLDVVLPKGYQDILRIDNGARGEGSEVEIAIGRETADNAYYAAFLQGLLLDSGSLITSFSDANFPGGMDYLAFIARDYALSVALPRAKVTGTVYLESGIAAPPLVFTKGALNYWLQTWSWNLYEDELEIEGLTLPSASLTVESETILESTAGASSTSGRASGGGGGSIAPGVSMAAVQEWVNGQGFATQTWVTGKGYLTGITEDMIADALGYTPLAPDDLLGYATQSWVTSQGYITGITATDIETALDYVPLGPDALNGYATQQWVNNKGYLLATTAASTYQPIISDLADIREGANLGSSAYQLPTSGIPKTDLAQAVRNSLALADSSIQAVYDMTLQVGGTTIGTFQSGVEDKTLTITAQNLYDAIGSTKYHPYGGENASTVEKTFYIGGALFTWHPASGSTPGYLELNSPFLTQGDQIVGSGTPGQGGGGGAGYLYELNDVADSLATPTNGMVLQYNGTEWIGVAASSIGGVTSVAGNTGAVTAAQIAAALTSAGYKLTDTTYTNGTGISLSGTTFSNSGVRSTTINGNYLRVNTNGTNADLTIPYATTASRLPRTNVVAAFDLNTALSGGGLAYNYGATSYWVNGPSGMSYGGVAEISQSGTALSAQFAWDIVHNVENGTRSLWYRAANNLGWGDWAEIYTSKSLTQSVVTNLIGTTTYAPYNANGYLPLTGGQINGTTSSPLTINTTASANYLYFATGGTNHGNIGYYNATVGMVFQCGDSYINIADGGELKKNNAYTFLHSGNYTTWINTTTFPGLTKTGTVTSVAMTVPTGLSVSGAPITTSGTLAISLASGYSIPTTAKQTTWDGKQDAIGDLSTIRNNAANGAAAYNALGNYVLKAGDTMTGNLTINGLSDGGNTAPLMISDAYASATWARFIRALYPNIPVGGIPHLFFGKDATARNGGVLAFYYAGSGSTSNLLTLGLSSVDHVLSVSGGGNVGVGLGTTPATYKLDVHQSGSSSGDVMRVSSEVSWANISYKATGTNRWAVGATQYGFGWWYEGLNDFAVFDTSGHLGIGTMTPHRDLDVVGVIQAGNASYNAVLETVTDGGALSFWGYGSSAWHNGYIDASTLLINSRTSGNVGIGITPSYKLHVNGTVGCGGLYCASTSSTAFAQVVNNTTMNWPISMAVMTPNLPVNGTHGFMVGRANSSGNTGIVSFRYVGAASTGNSISLGFHSNDFVINAFYSGNVTIGTGNTTDYGQKLYVAGNIHSTGDQVVSSDRTLKTNLKDVTYSVADIAKAPAVTFDWKDGRGRSAGSIAQYWKDILPELVHGEEGNMSLAYGQLALVNSILIAKQSEDHEKRIAKLERRVKELEMENEQLRLN